MRGLAAICLMLLVLPMLGCAAEAPAPTGRGLPSDFALSVYVAGVDAAEAPTDRRTGRYLLTVDRSLRAMLGPRAASVTLPPVVRRVEPRSIDGVYHWIRQAHLLAEPTSPLAEGPHRPAVGYQVRITAGGQTHTYRTTPDESPPTAQLVRMLAALARGRALE